MKANFSYQKIANKTKGPSTSEVMECTVILPIQTDKSQLNFNITRHVRRYMEKNEETTMEEKVKQKI